MKAVNFVIVLTCLAAAAIALKWTDGYHALYGVGQLLLLTSVAVLLRSRKRTPRKAVQSKEPPLFLQVVRGLTASGLIVGILWVGFAVLSLVGAPNPFHDSERIEFGLRLNELEQQQAFSKVVLLIDQKLPDVDSEIWKAELSSRLYANLVAAGKKTGSAQEAISYFTRAEQEATNDHESLLANLLLGQVKRRETFKEAEAACRDSSDWSNLVTLLTAVCKLRLEHQWDGDAKQELFDSLVEHGRTASSLDDAEAAFREAVSVAHKFELDGRTAIALADEIKLLHDLESQGRFPELIVLLEQRTDRFPDTQSARMMYNALLREASAKDELKEKVPLYRRAVEVAEKNNLKSDKATQQLAYVLARVGDRADFLEQVENLRHQEKYAELVRLLQQRVEVREKADWDFPLIQWQLDAYCRLADRSDIQSRITICRTALQVAKEHGLDASDVESRLIAAEKEVERRTAFLSKLAELKDQQRFNELLSVLQVHAESPRAEWLCPADQALYHAWLRWGDVADDLNEKLSRYKQAVETAKRFSLDTKDAEDKQHRVQAELDRLARLAAEQRRPRDLPPGTAAELVRVSTDPYPPSLVTYVQVVDGERVAIKDLQRKDFRVTIAGKPVENVSLAPVAQKPVPLSVLICLDTSGSTTNSLPVAVDGTKQLIQRLTMRNERVQLASFSSKTETVCAWTTDKAKLRRGLESLKPGGETALFATIAWAASELGKRPGDRCLVVFTDGRNTVGSASLTNTVAACQRSKVRIHAIGLKTKELDGNALSKLASETGGFYVEESSTHELSTLLADMSGRVRQHFYRLVLTPQASAPPLRSDSVIGVRVGGNNGVQLSERIGKFNTDVSVQSHRLP